MTVHPSSSAGDEPVLEDLVARCIVAQETEGESGVERVCAERPDLASQVRERLAELRERGLLDAIPLDSQHPERIGPYRVMEMLGHGGMGTVYLAEQRSPVVRKVALKVINPGMDSREVLTRFDRERQALAVMNHPNIAKIFDAGMTVRGRPYFVMEHVPGVPLTTYCDRHALPTRERLSLFVAVCEGVQHAHHKGVIHRDLKPSNVLVTPVDDRPVPKIIDFGVAKATDPLGTSGTLHTERGRVLGTPEYMSPEQAGRDGLDVDSRSDVYSLGVILFELLTGSLPFPSERLRESSDDEMRRILREQEPPTPSARVSTRGAESAAAARARRTDTQSLRRLLAGDLDWITLKALEKDRSRRYGTPLELAADLRRHLADEPVLAGPPGRAYRFVKFARRHRIEVTAAAAVLVALVVGLFVSLWFWVEARDSRIQETTARQLAEANFDKARAAVDEMLTRVGAEDLAQVPHMETIRRELLEQALQFYQGFLVERGDDPQVRIETARAYLRVGVIRGMLNNDAEAEDAFARAGAILSEPELERADALAVRSARAELLQLRGQLLAKLGRDEEAGASYLEGIGLAEQLAADRLGGEANAIRLADLHHRLGRLLRTNDPPRARRAFERAVAIAETLADGSPGSVDADRRLIAYLSDLGHSLTSVSSMEAAERALERARDRADARVSAGERDPALRQALAHVWSNIVALRYATDRFDEAADAAAATIAIWQGLRRDFPGIPSYRASLASVQSNLALTDAQRGDYRMAEERGKQAIAEWEGLAGEYPAVPDYRLRLATTLNNVGRAPLNLRLFGGDVALDDSERNLSRAIELLRELREEQRDDAEVLRELALASSDLGILFRITGRPEAAYAKFAEAAEILERLVLRHPDQSVYPFRLGGTLKQWGQLLLQRGEAAAAIPRLERAIAQLRAGLAIDPDKRLAHEYLRDATRDLGMAFVAVGDRSRAAGVADDLTALLEGEWLPLDMAARVLLRCAETESAVGTVDAIARAADYAARAERAWARAIVIQEKELERHAGHPMWHAVLARTHGRLASAVGLRGAGSLAVSHLEAATVHARAAFQGSGNGGGSGHGSSAQRLRDAFRRMITAVLDEGDHAGAVGHAAAMVEVFSDSADDRFEAACVFAQAAALAGEDPDLAPDARRRAQAELSARAVDELRASVARGFADRKRLEDDVRLQGLRARAAFRQLADQLGGR